MRRNSSTWRYFACRLGFIRPSWSERPSATNTGSSSGSSRPLSRSWSRSASTLRVAGGGVQQRVALLRHAHLVRLRGGVDVPVAEGLLEQRVHGGAGLVAGQVVRRVRLPVVVRRHLEVAAGLEVDVTQLHATPGRRVPAATPGRHGAHQRVGVEDLLAQLGQHAEQGLGRHSDHFSRAATTTMSRSAPSAAGMIRRRWRGFTCRVYGWPRPAPHGRRRAPAGSRW